MSLTGHLNTRESPVKRFLMDRFPATKVLTVPANKMLRAHGCICHPPALPVFPFGDVGRAIDYRIRYFYPPVASRELAAWQGGQDLKMVAREFAVAGAADSRQIVASHVIDDFFTSLDAFIVATHPAGRLLDTNEEAILARYCFVLSLLEARFRSSQTAQSLYLPRHCQNVEGLLAIASEPVVQDLVYLAQQFSISGQKLLSRPAVLNPVFAGSADIGGADADLIIDRQLVEIKTTKNNVVEAAWLRQLLGYVLLDYDDVLQVNTVGLYLARHGMLLSWPIPDLLMCLSKGRSVDLGALRVEFRQVVSLATPCGQAGVSQANYQ